LCIFVSRCGGSMKPRQGLRYISSYTMTLTVAAGQAVQRLWDARLCSSVNPRNALHCINSYALTIDELHP